MLHITPERIAALADEPATLPERTHLESCMDCTAELVVAQRLMRMAMTDTPAIVPLRRGTVSLLRCVQKV
jgi:hypothetical protein